MKRIVFWIILFTVMNCSTDKTPPPKRNARNAGSPPQHGKLFKYGQTNCPDSGTASDVECGMCGACLHSFLEVGAVSRTAYPSFTFVCG